MRLRLGRVIASVGVVAVVAFWFWPRPTTDPAVARQPTGATTGYVIENGQVAWRPMTTGEQIFVAIISFGQAVNSESVRGRTLGNADASTFRTIAGRYGLDQNHVWFDGRQIIGADPDSFAVLPRGFSRDADQVWKGGTAVLSVTADTVIDVHSDHIVSLDDQTWFASIPSIQLPERPTSEPRHFCRHWFAMNDAIWLGGDKVLAVADGEAVAPLDCDNSVLRRYENNIPREDITANDGLVLVHGATLTQLKMTGETTTLTEFPEPIVGTAIIGSGFGFSHVVLAQAATGQVYAAGWDAGRPVQTLGAFEKLPHGDDILFDTAFWMDGSYFTVVDPEDTSDALVIDRGQATRLGRYAQVGDFIYDRGAILAAVDGLDVRLVRDDTLLLGNMCLSYGSYITDVADPMAEPSDITQQCDVHRRPDTVRYEGLRINFAPLIRPLGPAQSQPDLTNMAVGRLTLENTSEQPIDLPAWFLGGFELAIIGTVITPPDDAWPAAGATLAPGEAVSWVYDVNSDDDPTNWAWTVKMRHSEKRSYVLGDDPFHILGGQFFGAQ